MERTWKFGLFDYPTGIPDTSIFPLAARTGYDGVEFQIVNSTSGRDLRDPAQCAEYLKAAQAVNLVIPSITANYMNSCRIPSDPEAPRRLSEAIEAAQRLGVREMLVPCNGANDIREENQTEFERACDVLRDVSSHAGVTLCIENGLPAEKNLRLLDRIGTGQVRLYYDLGIMCRAGYDVPQEIRKLKDAIRRVHISDALPFDPPEARMRVLLSQARLPLPAIAEALGAIGYEGWLILEANMPPGAEEDLRQNLEFVRRVFRK